MLTHTDVPVYTAEVRAALTRFLAEVRATADQTKGTQHEGCDGTQLISRAVHIIYAAEALSALADEYMNADPAFSGVRAALAAEAHAQTMPVATKNETTNVSQHSTWGCIAYPKLT